MNAPTVRLAYAAASDAAKALEKGHLETTGVLVSYYYLKSFERLKSRECRDWVMDSGAFSAHNSNVKIDLREYIAKCGHLLDIEKNLTEVFALDVIGNHRASLLNAERAWDAGIPAIPCYHAGEPWDFLLHIAKYYPKIAIGGVARKGEDVKWKFAEQCFARVWPKKIHGFGMSSEPLVMGFPFHSVDSTSWEIAPLAFGNWQKFKKMDSRAKNFKDKAVDLRSEIKYFGELEQKARVRWQKEMKLLDEIER